MIVIALILGLDNSVLKGKVVTGLDFAKREDQLKKRKEENCYG
jgi:hypothetical protein